jgi:hypothetical protein
LNGGSSPAWSVDAAHGAFLGAKAAKIAKGDFGVVHFASQNIAATPHHQTKNLRGLGGKEDTSSPIASRFERQPITSHGVHG